MKLKRSKETIISTLVLLLAVAFVWFFTNIVVYMIIAAVVALLAKPLKELLEKIKLKGKSLPNALLSSIILLVLLLAFGAIFIILLPAIGSQASDLSQLDYNQIAENINHSLQSTENLLKDYGVLASGESLDQILKTYINGFVGSIQINQMASQAVNAVGGIFMGFFSVLFMAFFFIKDESLFHNIILLFVPDTRKKAISHIMLKVRIMLSRYFVGLLTEVGSMMILLSIGGLIIGLPNAILIGFIGGLLNIIPYIGPMIGAFIGASLVLISNISMGMDSTLPLIYGILAVFAIANMLDNFLLQPLIYSNSVKAHPLEIFVVIIVGGSLYGPLGMILAIPVYTILRVIAKEFLSDQAFFQKVTKNL